MYIHMFAFRWKPEATEARQAQAAREIQDLRNHIPGILETWVGTNVSPRGAGYEFGGVMKFADKESLLAYSDHPAHQKLLSWLVPLIEPIEVDFPISESQ